jgi:hypothetical protein
MKYFEKISAPIGKNVLNYLPIKIPTSPGQKGKFYKLISKKIQSIQTKGLD